MIINLYYVYQHPDNMDYRRNCTLKSNIIEDDCWLIANNKSGLSVSDSDIMVLISCFSGNTPTLETIIYK